MANSEVRASAKYIRISPQKMRQVLSLVRGKTVEEALDLLELVPKRGARLLKKVVESAAANARQENSDCDPSEMVIHRVWADTGPRLRRVRPRARFRRDIYVRPTSHVTVVLSIPRAEASS